VARTQTKKNVGSRTISEQLSHEGNTAPSKPAASYTDSERRRWPQL